MSIWALKATENIGTLQRLAIGQYQHDPTNTGFRLALPPEDYSF